MVLNILKSVKSYIQRDVKWLTDWLEIVFVLFLGPYIDKIKCIRVCHLLPWRWPRESHNYRVKREASLWSISRRQWQRKFKLKNHGSRLFRISLMRGKTLFKISIFTFNCLCSIIFQYFKVYFIFQRCLAWCQVLSNVMATGSNWGSRKGEKEADEVSPWNRKEIPYPWESG